MSYKKPSTLRRIRNVIKYTLGGITVLVLLLLLTYSAYRGVTDIDYLEPHVVTELGQCSGGDNANTRCKARAGNLLITADNPMMLGQTMYRECWFQRDGQELCRGWTYRTWGDPFREEALREHKERW